MRQYEYARSGLKLGLSQHAKLGVNPFKFGMIGSTDAHDSLSRAGANIFLSELIRMAASTECQNPELIPLGPPSLASPGGVCRCLGKREHARSTIRSNET